MKNLKLIRQSIKDVAITLANDSRIQRLLLVDTDNPESASFTPLSAAEMLAQNYICLTPQNEDGVKKMGRNTFLILTIEDIALSSVEDNTGVTARVFVITDINHAIINGADDRALLIADYIYQDLQNLKLSSAGAINVTYISRVAFNETLAGYQITYRYNDKTENLAEI